VLERIKNVGALLQAWRQAAPRVPGAVLHVVGRGSLSGPVEELVAEQPERTRWTPILSNHQVSEELDASTVLVLPSLSEGLPRVALEAISRGRGVIGTDAPGVRDVVEDGVNGVLVRPDDVQALADALVRVLSDRPFAEALGRGAQATARRWVVSADEYADRVYGLVERALAR
jgi:glycosyltransferase involved in cell wall biosynthesis